MNWPQLGPVHSPQAVLNRLRQQVECGLLSLQFEIQPDYRHHFGKAFHRIALRFRWTASGVIILARYLPGFCSRTRSSPTKDLIVSRGVWKYAAPFGCGKTGETWRYLRRISIRFRLCAGMHPPQITQKTKQSGVRFSNRITGDVKSLRPSLANELLAIRIASAS